MLSNYTLSGQRGNEIVNQFGQWWTNYSSANGLAVSQSPAGGANPSTGSGNNTASTKGGMTGAPWGAIGQGISSMMSPINDAAASKGGYTSESNQLGLNVRKGASDAAIASNNPIAMAIGVGSKVVDGAMDASGLRGTSISKDFQNRADISGFGRFHSNWNNFLPGNPLALGGSKLSDSYVSMEAMQNVGSYADSIKDFQYAQEYGGKRMNFLMGLTGDRDKTENFIQKSNREADLLDSITTTTTNRLNNSSISDNYNRNINRVTGTGAKVSLSKKGSKLINLLEAREFLNSVNLRKTDESIESFQNGGTIGIDTNILPEGALHKNKNHLEEVNEELDRVTEKGIPVIVTDENGDYKQVAEIEKEEIIFRKEITKKLEELWKKGDDESMIEAGKLLAEEIITNTQDNTNQLADIQDGEN